MTYKIKFKINEDLDLLEPDINMEKELFDLIDSNREFLNRYISFAQFKDTPASIKAFLREIINFNFGGQKFNTIIRYQNKLAGILAFHRIDKINRRAEIGYWLGEQFVGKGLISQSMKPFLKHGFEVFKINRVNLLTMHSHKKSIALAERNGFVREGLLRQYFLLNEQFHDTCIFALLEEDFQG